MLFRMRRVVEYSSAEDSPPRRVLEKSPSRSPSKSPSVSSPGRRITRGLLSVSQSHAWRSATVRRSSGSGASGCRGLGVGSGYSSPVGSPPLGKYLSPTRSPQRRVRDRSRGHGRQPGVHSCRPRGRSSRPGEDTPDFLSGANGMQLYAQRSTPSRGSVRTDPAGVAGSSGALESPAWSGGYKRFVSLLRVSSDSLSDAVDYCCPLGTSQSPCW